MGSVRGFCSPEKKSDEALTGWVTVAVGAWARTAVGEDVRVMRGARADVVLGRLRSG